MTKRQIKVTINPDATIKVDNAGNPDEQKILAELSELSQLLNGDKKGFEIEKHVHTHGGHNHSHITVGGKTS